MMRVNVIGIPAALARLTALEVAAKAAARPMAEAEAQPIEVAAKARAPVLTGTLRDSIHTEPDPENANAVLVGSDVDYAIYVEYGTSDTPMQPFLRPAVDDASGGNLATAILRRLFGR
jgi:HK97 gp10 family phage protein